MGTLLTVCELYEVYSKETLEYFWILMVTIDINLLKVVNGFPNPEQLLSLFNWFIELDCVVAE